MRPKANYTLRSAPFYGFDLAGESGARIPGPCRHQAMQKSVQEVSKQQSDDRCSTYVKSLIFSRAGSRARTEREQT